jgi:hypothetical protein
MAKTSPEKLSQALRANLKRRKQGAAAAAPAETPVPAPEKPSQPAKN